MLIFRLRRRSTMKSKFLAVVFVLVGFKILDATDRDLLKDFMDANLYLPPDNNEGLQLEINPIIILNSSFGGNVSTLPPLKHTVLHTPPPSPPPCPREVNIAWQLRPPYTLERNDSDGQPVVDGIIHQVLDVALDECCSFYRGRKPILRYLTVSSNSSALLRNAFNESVSLVFPIHKEQYNIIGFSRTYINIIDSPGVVLIQINPTYSIERSDHLFKALLGTWPIVVLSLLMSCLAGICIWMLDSRTNGKEFGSPSYRGAFDGFWWAFVTMSTVGYGDKTPKSTIARLFSVLWIIIGITICSMLTATLSSALTSVTVKKYDFTSGKTFGVQRESFAFKQAVNLGINVTDFETLYDEANDLLENGKVEGILEDMFAGIEFIKWKTDSGLSIAEVFEKQHGYGVAINRYDFGWQVPYCLEKVIEFVTDEIFSNASRLLKSHTVSTSEKQMESAEVHESDHSIFYPESTSFQTTVIGMSVVVLAFITCSVGFEGARCLRRKRTNDLEAGKT